MRVEKDHIRRGGAHSIDAGGAGVSNDDAVGWGQGTSDESAPR
jgi:hypothetical protein